MEKERSFYNLQDLADKILTQHAGATGNREMIDVLASDLFLNSFTLSQDASFLVSAEIREALLTQSPCFAIVHVDEQLDSQTVEARLQETSTHLDRQKLAQIQTAAQLDRGVGSQYQEFLTETGNSLRVSRVVAMPLLPDADRDNVFHTLDGKTTFIVPITPEQWTSFSPYSTVPDSTQYYKDLVIPFSHALRDVRQPNPDRADFCLCERCVTAIKRITNGWDEPNVQRIAKFINLHLKVPDVREVAERAFRNPYAYGFSEVYLDPAQEHCVMVSDRVPVEDPQFVQAFIEDCRSILLSKNVINAFSIDEGAVQKALLVDTSGLEERIYPWFLPVSSHTQSSQVEYPRTKHVAGKSIKWFPGRFPILQTEASGNISYNDLVSPRLQIRLVQLADGWRTSVKSSRTDSYATPGWYDGLSQELICKLSNTSLQQLEHSFSGIPKNFLSPWEKQE